MDRTTKTMAKIICYGSWASSSPTTSCMCVMPYVVVLPGSCGVGYLFHEYRSTIDAGSKHATSTNERKFNHMENNNHNPPSLGADQGRRIDQSQRQLLPGLQETQSRKTSVWKRRTCPTSSSAWATNACCPKIRWQNLAVIEGRAHALVEANTFPFLNGLGHFLPNSKLAEVTGKLKELETEFWAAKKAFLEKYASLRQSASKEWRKMAEKLVKDPDRLVATIEASFPYPDQMERYYGFDVQLFQIAMPQHMAAELVIGIGTTGRHRSQAEGSPGSRPEDPV